ncbi:uncharacterized protein Tco025E_08387 [Trypanosoma conorhini]|uniref:Uncharacterized protein n=1 Tax=Trypanosoma conorhini TaxID=83891 RepID=A0A3S5IQW9_9TRYP|nr:uncharacterized protein Tco025E_08387 [Trypanosoma conorhini]RNF02886.1 hypothetical protein Tco025E_08387 [Trypanosoma conorhini]
MRSGPPPTGLEVSGCRWPGPTVRGVRKRWAEPAVCGKAAGVARPTLAAVWGVLSRPRIGAVRAIGEAGFVACARACDATIDYSGPGATICSFLGLRAVFFFFALSGTECCLCPFPAPPASSAPLDCGYDGGCRRQPGCAPRQFWKST